MNFSDLIIKVKQGDEKAFSELFHHYRGKLFNFIRLSLMDEWDIENIVQEVFIRIWIKRETIDPEQGIEPFMFTIAKNLIKDQLRKQLIRQKFITALSQAEQKTDIHDINILEIEQLEQQLNMLIDQMPERRREIFMLSRVEGKTYKQISDELGISVNTVDTQIRRALEGLKKTYSQATIWIF